MVIKCHHLCLTGFLVALVSFGCQSSIQPDTKANSRVVPKGLESSQRGLWHFWHKPSNMTASGYCVLKFAYGNNDVGDAWLYKLDGLKLRPVILLSKNINAGLDLDTIYETSTFVEVLMCYQPYYPQILRFDPSTKSIVRNYKTQRGMALDPVFPEKANNQHGSSTAIITQAGPVFVRGVEGKEASLISIEAPNGLVEHHTSSLVRDVALVNNQTLVFTFPQGRYSQSGLVTVPVERLLDKDIETHFQSVTLVPPPR